MVILLSGKVVERVPIDEDFLTIALDKATTFLLAIFFQNCLENCTPKKLPEYECLQDSACTSESPSVQLTRSSYKEQNAW